MLIEITDHKKLSDVKDAFSNSFPGLKLEFFKHPHHWYEDSSFAEELDDDLLIGDVRKHHEQGFLQFFSDTKTGELEQLFFDGYGLCVQVFRLENGNWVQTSLTDKLSLAAQQREISKD